MKLQRPELVWKNYKKLSKRERAYPFVVAGTIVAIIVLMAIKECC